MMKNEQKFKTANERIKAFNEWRRTIKCEGCSQLCDTCEAGPLADECGFKWLALEAKNEKPEPCPFCGGMCVAYDKVVVCQNVKCDYRSGSYDNRYATIAAHNRVARAVRAAKESEARDG